MWEDVSMCVGVNVGGWEHVCGRVRMSVDVKVGKLEHACMWV